MFGSLREKLKKSVQKLADKVKETPGKQPFEKKKAVEKPKKEEAAKPIEKKPVKKVEKIEKPKPEKTEKPAPVQEETKPEPVKREPETEPFIEEPKSIEGEVKPEAEPEQKPKQPESIKEKKEISETEGKEEVTEHEEPIEQRKGFFGRLRGIKEVVVEKTLEEKDIESFFNESEAELLQANVALEAIDHMRESMKKETAGKKIKRREAEQFISAALESSLLGLVDHGSVDLDEVIKKAKSEGKTACLIFLGFNGAGKTTSIAKCARYLMDKGYSVVLAAGDTFRAASIEQLEHHGEKLGVKVIKHQYGSDSAAVIFDARKHAEAKGIDVVLADTAGRMHTDKNLADELKKVIRVNQPELKILLVDSLTGNDAVEQAKNFHEMVGVDAVIMAKTDVNEKGGSILSVSYAIKKPILFLGTGQEYKDLKKFDPKVFVKELLA